MIAESAVSEICSSPDVPSIVLLAQCTVIVSWADAGLALAGGGPQAKARLVPARTDISDEEIARPDRVTLAISCLRRTLRHPPGAYVSATGSRACVEHLCPGKTSSANEAVA